MCLWKTASSFSWLLSIFDFTFPVLKQKGLKLLISTWVLYPLPSIFAWQLSGIFIIIVILSIIIASRSSQQEQGLHCANHKRHTGTSWKSWQTEYKIRNNRWEQTEVRIQGDSEVILVSMISSHLGTPATYMLSRILRYPKNETFKKGFERGWCVNVWMFKVNSSQAWGTAQKTAQRGTFENQTSGQCWYHRPVRARGVCLAFFLRDNRESRDKPKWA